MFSYLYVIGGYSKAKWIRWYKDKFLQRGSFNVIGVYWGGGAKRNYFQAAGNTRLVGAQIAFLIERMHTVNRLSYSNVHLIGFSLGAHVAGFAGRRLRANGHPIARITGLHHSFLGGRGALVKWTPSSVTGLPGSGRGQFFSLLYVTPSLCQVQIHYWVEKLRTSKDGKKPDSVLRHGSRNMLRPRCPQIMTSLLAFRFLLSSFVGSLYRPP